MLYRHICKYCGKELTVEARHRRHFASLIAAHESKCESNPNRDKYFLAKHKAGKLGGKATKEKWKNVLKDEKEHAIKYDFVCEKCGKSYSKILTSREFEKYRQAAHHCSRSCANTRHQSDESKRKTSQSMLAWAFEKDPKGCQTFEEYCDMRKQENLRIPCKHPGCTNLVQATSKTGYCRKHLANDRDHIERMRKTQLQQYKDGKRTGWIRRNVESYPEKFFKVVLEKNNIPFEFNYPVQKSKLGLESYRLVHYFLDFKIGDNIDLEIDGGQHLNPENQLHDKERDDALTRNGWIVYRIPWNEINTEEGKLKMENKINNFLLWLKNHNPPQESIY